MAAGRAAPAEAPDCEVQVALALDGGVSLAIWIGGVTREVDAAASNRYDWPTVQATYHDPSTPWVG